MQFEGFPGGSEVKASARNAGGQGLIPGSGRFPWRRKRQPTQVFLPGESHGRRNLMGYSPQGHKSWTRLSDFALLSLYFYYYCTNSTSYHQALVSGVWGHLGLRGTEFQFCKMKRVLEMGCTTMCKILNTPDVHLEMVRW